MLILSLSVEQEVNGMAQSQAVWKEIREEEIVIRKMFIKLNITREVGMCVCVRAFLHECVRCMVRLMFVSPNL
jgi:hypothetical protein